MKHNILIVEDHALTRFGLKTAFENIDYINKIFEAQDANEAFSIIKENDISVILMDLGLPKIDGIEATKIIKSQNKNIKIIILTSHSSSEEVLDAVKAGAISYCSKDVKPKELVDIVKSVLDGAAWFDPKVSQIILQSLSQNNTEINDKKNDKFNLTKRETQVLQLIADGLNNQEIAKILKVSVNTTKVHVCGILQKLSVDDRTQAAIKAYKYNLVK